MSTKTINNEARLNLVTANVEEIAKLPYISEKVAQRIVDLRCAGKLHNISDLKEVKGIGDKIYDKINQLVAIYGETLRDKMDLMEENHHLDEALIEAQKKKDKGFYSQNLFFFKKKVSAPGQKAEYRVLCSIREQMIPATLTNERFILNKPQWFMGIAGEARLRDRGTKDIITISAASSIGTKQTNEIVNDILKDGLVLLYDENDILVDVVSRDEKYGCVSYVNPRNDIKEIVNPDGEREFYINSKKHSYRLFGGEGGVIFSAAQSRGTRWTCYNCTTKQDRAKFNNALNDATDGEFKLRFGEVMDMKSLVDANNRLSSKTTGTSLTAAQGSSVKNILFVFGTYDGTDNADGMAFLRTKCIADSTAKAMGVDYLSPKQFVGEGLQHRTKTAKAASLAFTDEQMLRLAENYKVFVAEYGGGKKIDKELQEAINNRLVKTHRKNKTEDKLTGYSAILFKHVEAEDNIPDFIGDINAIKDGWDYNTAPSGINVLHTSHFDENTEAHWNLANTGTQCVKVFLASLSDKSLKERFDKYFKGVIDSNLKKDVSFEARVKRFKFEEINVEYLAGFLQDINPNCLEKFPTLFKEVCKDKINTMTKRINNCRYAVPGAPALIFADPASTLTLGKIKLLDAKQAFVPAANRYFKEHDILTENHKALGMKYPSVGRFEGLIFDLVDIDFIKDKLCHYVEKGELSEEDASLIFESYLNLKEGNAFIAADINKVARVLAGLDFDGDKIIFYYSDNEDNVIKIMEDAGFKGREVKIVPPEVESDIKVTYNGKAYNKQMRAKIKAGNHSVGEVTISHDIYTNCLNIGEKSFKFLKKVAPIAFDMKKGATGVYKHVVVPDENGVYEISEKIARKAYDQIKHCAVTWENLKAFLEDLDVIGRYDQELTIDADKKFYDVFIEFITRQKQIPGGVKTLSRAAYIDFTFGENVELITMSPSGKPSEFVKYFIDDNGEVQVTITEQKVVDLGYGHKYTKFYPTVLVDAFDEYRRYAATVAFKLINEMNLKYKDAMRKAIQTGVFNGVKHQNVITKLDNAGITESLKQVIRMIMTVNKSYHDYWDKLREFNAGLRESLASSEQEKLDDEIKSLAHAYAKEGYDVISNEIRRIVGKKVPMVFVLAYLSSYEYASALSVKKGVEDKEHIKGEIIPKILIPETAKFFADYAEINVAKERITARDEEYLKDALAVGEVTCSFVENEKGEKVRKFFREDPFSEKNIELKIKASFRVGEGKYPVVYEDGEYFLTKPISDFIVCPEVDNDTVAVPLQNYSNINISVRKTIEVLKSYNGDIGLYADEYKGKYKAFKKLFVGKMIDNDKADRIGMAEIGYDKAFDALLPIYKNITGKIQQIIAGGNFGILVLKDAVRKEKDILPINKTEESTSSASRISKLTEKDLFD